MTQKNLKILEKKRNKYFSLFYLILFFLFLRSDFFTPQVFAKNLIEKRVFADFRNLDFFLNSGFIKVFFKTQKIKMGATNGSMKPLLGTSSNTNQNRPESLKGVGVSDPIGEKIDFNLVFRNEKGEEKTLGSYFESHQPLLLAIVYYECPSLCNYHVKALLSGLLNLKWTVGRDFKVIFVSMDEREGPDLAFQKKEALLKSYNRKGGEKGFHLLTGTKENIKKLSENLNFKFKWIEEQEVFSHSSVTYVFTPKGKVSQTLSGLDSSAKNIKLSLLKASQGKLGTFVDKILLYCYRFDPKSSKYTLYAYNVMKLGGGMTVFLLFSFLIFSFFYQGKKNRSLKP